MTRGRAFLLGAACLMAAMAKGQTLDLSHVAPVHAGLKGCQGEACLIIHDSLTAALESALLAPGAMDLPMVENAFLAAVESENLRLKVLTWNWAHPDRTSGYGGLIAFRDDKGNVTVIRMLDRSSADAPHPQRSLKAEEWHGALYYDMVPSPVDKATWLLLGWDDADAQVTRKVIEPLQIRSNGIRFGAPVLSTELGMQRRWVLEYADPVQVSLRYQDAEKGAHAHPERIIFDHLAPNEPHLSGISAYYGPDMTFDAFVPGKKPGQPWLMEQNVKVAQDVDGNVPFIDPRPRNRRNNRR